jgi:hypothetical protein
MVDTLESFQVTVGNECNPAGMPVRRPVRRYAIATHNDMRYRAVNSQ